MYIGAGNGVEDGSSRGVEDGSSREGSITPVMMEADDDHDGRGGSPSWRLTKAWPRLVNTRPFGRQYRKLDVVLDHDDAGEEGKREDPGSRVW